MSLLPKTDVVVVENRGGEAKISKLFDHAGLPVETAETGSVAIGLIQRQNFDLAIVDLRLDDESALGVVRCIREMQPLVAILVLARGDDRQGLLMALEAGADDFLTEPVSSGELLMRSRVAILRSRNRPQKCIEVGPLSLDLEKRRVARDGAEVALTPTELRILEILMKNRSLVVSRRTLCEFLWSPNWEGITNVIEVHINRLRRKVEAPGQPRLIKTVRGRGYLIDA